MTGSGEDSGNGEVIPLFGAAEHYGVGDVDPEERIIDEWMESRGRVVRKTEREAAEPGALEGIVRAVRDRIRRMEGLRPVEPDGTLGPSLADRIRANGSDELPETTNDD